MKAIGSRALAASAIILMSASLASAAEIKVVTVGGLQKGIGPIAADFTKDTGHKVIFNFTNPANLQKTLSTDGPFDVVVVATGPVSDLGKAGKLIAGSQVKAVRGGIAVSFKEGAKKPDVSTPEALKAAVLAAKNIVLTDPATPNGSGEKTKRILSGLGVWDAALAKAKIEGLGPGKALVAKGDYELGFFNASEAEAPGCVIAGVVPASIQQFTNYDAAVLGDAASKDVGAAFVKYLSSPSAQARWKAARLEPEGM